MHKQCMVDDVHWISGSPPDKRFTCTAQVRYRHHAAVAEVEVLTDARVSLSFDEPQFAVTPGQAAVMYDGDVVLGGGWIMAALEPNG